MGELEAVTGRGPARTTITPRSRASALCPSSGTSVDLLAARPEDAVVRQAGHAADGGQGCTRPRRPKPARLQVEPIGLPHRPAAVRRRPGPQSPAAPATEARNRASHCGSSPGPAPEGPGGATNQRRCRPRRRRAAARAPRAHRNAAQSRARGHGHDAIRTALRRGDHTDGLPKGLRRASAPSTLPIPGSAVSSLCSTPDSWTPADGTEARLHAQERP